jgi:hypothetical protein
MYLMFQGELCFIMVNSVYFEYEFCLTFQDESHC